MTRISDQMDILRQCSPIDLQPGSLPFLKPCSYFFITHIHAELVRFGVDGDNISVCPSRTRTPYPHVNEGRSESAPTQDRGGEGYVFLHEPSEVHIKNTSRGSRTLKDGYWATDLRFRHDVAYFEVIFCLSDNETLTLLHRGIMKCYVPTINP